MYLSHFGLREAPFGLTPNTGFYYGLPPHEEAMQVLNWALSQ
nr:AAA family ATPase [Aeromonas sp.]